MLRSRSGFGTGDETATAKCETSSKLPCGGKGTRERSSSVTVPDELKVARAQTRGAGLIVVAPPVFASRITTSGAT